MALGHHWDIFCRVIDNYGDAGVCWRLARDLARRGTPVRLWIDDATPLTWMAPQGCEGVSVHAWADAPAQYEPGQVVIEAFGCELDDAVKAKLAKAAQQDRQPAWINLEYLSAEDYVERSHGLPSPQMSGPAKGLVKHFFYPGFTERTGGLIREPDLPVRQQNFKASDWLQSQGIPLVTAQGETPRISLFCYEPPALRDLIEQLLEQERPSQLLVTHGRSAAHCRNTLAAMNLPEHGTGQLQIIYLPALTQDDYDHLLWACDLNFVRGEDSLVRAIWAGKPFVWNIYPQDDGAHVAKLRAFLGFSGFHENQQSGFGIWNQIKLGKLDPVLTLCDHVLYQSLRCKLLVESDLSTNLLSHIVKLVEDERPAEGTVSQYGVPAALSKPQD
jgi:uncharacterized repeat protein (TIGR03837 family)